MKRIYLTLSAAAIATALLVPAAVSAQKEDKDVKDKKDKSKHETIVITKKSDSNEKVTVVIDGDKVTVNGKPIEDLKDGDITVNRHSYGDLNSYRAFSRNGQNFWNGNDNFTVKIDENTAMLGVTSDKDDQGVKITDITEGGGAQKAGLKENDIITKIDDKKIETPDDLTKAIRAHKPGDKVSVTYLRDKKEQKVTAELTKWKGFSFGTFDMKGLNMDAFEPRFKTPSPNVNVNPLIRDYMYHDNRPKLGLSIQDSDDGKGVQVIEVDEESNSAKAGLKKDDIILAINDKDVNSVDEVSKVVRELREKPSMNVRISRGGKHQTIEVKMPRKIKTADL